MEQLYYLNQVLSHLDVLSSFAVCAVSAPVPYVRPTILEKGSGKMELLQVRHPCMELQDGVNFIPNDAVFENGSDSFKKVVSCFVMFFIRQTGLGFTSLPARIWAVRARISDLSVLPS